jgi:geranylgeranyl pyrophosphate synthase
MLPMRKSFMNMHQAMQEVEDIMLGIVSSDVEVLRNASLHILSAGGKRIRPRLLMLSYLALGGSDFRYAAPVAAAIELVHTASVVHDDINDHGVVRRGRPSINAIWGRTFALLTGDFLFTKVYELMAPYKDLNIVLAEATVALVEGETLQASAVKEMNFSREVYYRIIALKTAALFKAAACLGAQLANASDKIVDAMGQFGYNLGLAFQITDDVLDLTADSHQLGKTAGIDLTQGRGYAAAYSASAQMDNGFTLAPEIEAVDPLKEIKAKMLRGEAISEARLQAQQLSLAAVSFLDLLPESAAKQGLVDLARIVVEREN